MRSSHPLKEIERYGTTAQLFHWLTALLVLLAYITSPGGSEARVYAPGNEFARGLHELIGLSVFTLTLLRLTWRTVFPPPRNHDDPVWMRNAALLAHWAIYGLLVLVPLTAILGAWLAGHPLSPLVLGNIQPWVSQYRQLGIELAVIHGSLGNVLIWLAGAHAAAALYHHFWRRDAILLSMLPAALSPRRRLDKISAVQLQKSEAA
jgi:cytochrome b561